MSAPRLSDADPLDLTAATTAVRQAVSDLHGAAERAAPPAWPLVDAALRHLHRALIALDELVDVPLPLNTTTKPEPLGAS